jgi:transposase
MEVSLFLPLCDGLQIEQVTQQSNQLLVSIGSRSPNACCPLCRGQAWRIHSHYTRRVADLPCAGQHMTLRLRVRKFFCPHPACPRKIFAEQFPQLVLSYARMTNRLRDALVALGLATSAQVSERVAPKLGMSVSAPSLLRCLRSVDCPPPTSVRILGVDDWGATRSYICSCKNS